MGPVDGAAANAPAWGVTLAWDPNPESDLAGYRILYGTSAGNATNVLEVGKVTQVAVFNLTQGATYYFAAKAYNQGGLESDPSTEISAVISRPYVVDSLSTAVHQAVTTHETGVRFSTGLKLGLTWPASSLPNLAGYRVHYGWASNDLSVVVDAGNVTNLNFVGLTPGTNYYFSVAAYDAGGTAQPLPAPTGFASPASGGSGSSSLALSEGSEPEPVEPPPLVLEPGGSEGGIVTNQVVTVSGSATNVVDLGFGTGLKVTLAWDPNPEPDLAGYKLLYGQATNALDGVVDVGNVTQVMVTNLQAATTYYFSVKAYNTGGLESDPAAPISHTTAEVPPAPTVVETAPTVPPLPPLPPGMVTGGTSTSPSGPTAPVPPSTTAEGLPEVPDREARVPVMPPRVGWSRTNVAQVFVIVGTVGATYEVQTRSSLHPNAEWTTVTNLTLTNAMAVVEAPAGLPEILRQAFEPGDQTYDLPGGLQEPQQFYRVVMRDSYPLLADQNLRQRGQATRLIAVRLPGIDSYVVCYVPSESAAIDYVPERATARLLSSGSTIRQIASKVAATLAMNWTSASEFTYSEGFSQLVATVVKTEDPARDPAPDARGSVIKIDF